MLTVFKTFIASTLLLVLIGSTTACSHDSDLAILDQVSDMIVENHKDGCVPELVSVESDQEKANFIVERILDFLKAGTDLRDQAVLFRNVG